MEVKHYLHEGAKGFISRFQLSKHEISVLHGQTREKLVSEEFFTIVNRLQAIHRSCRILMQSDYQTLGLDVMQRMTLLQEVALKRLSRWTQNQCRHIENEHIAPLLIKAMCKLQDKPVLLKYIDEYYPGSKTGGTPNPIEMRADMIPPDCWRHASIAASSISNREREHLYSLKSLRQNRIICHCEDNYKVSMSKDLEGS